MQYLQNFPADVRPALEATVLDAEQRFPLGAPHLGGRSARGDALRFATHACCACAAELCLSVARGQLPYLELSPLIETLLRSLIRDTYNRSELRRFARYETGDELSYERFERLANQSIETAQLWQLVQLKRIDLSGKDRDSPSMAAGTSALDRRLAVLQEAAQANDRQRAEGHDTDGLSMAEFSALFANWIAPPHAVAPENVEDRKRRRKAQILPLLRKYRINRNKWATRAGVSRSVVYDYVNGVSTPQDNNAKAMAQVIGLAILPE
jgi:hypothetical protein